MHRWPLLLITAAVTACGGGGGCPPLVGCVSALTVALPASAVSVRACVADVCATEVVAGAVQVPLGRRADGTTAALTVEVVDAAGVTTSYAGEAALTRTRPNGSACPPVCVTGSVRLTAGGGVVDA